MKTYTAMQIGTVYDALVEQVANPTRALVNSESSFVKYRIAKTDSNLANEYWYWVCSSKRNEEVFGSDVAYLQDCIEAIDSQQSMPSWGCAGT